MLPAAGRGPDLEHTGTRVTGTGGRPGMGQLSGSCGLWLEEDGTSDPAAVSGVCLPKMGVWAGAKVCMLLSCRSVRGPR